MSGKLSATSSAAASSLASAWEPAALSVASSFAAKQANFLTAASSLALALEPAASSAASEDQRSSGLRTEADLVYTLRH